MFVLTPNDEQKHVVLVNTLDETHNDTDDYDITKIGNTLHDMIDVVNHVHEPPANDNSLSYLISRMHVRLIETDPIYQTECAVDDYIAKAYATNNPDNLGDRYDVLDIKITAYQAQCIFDCFEKRNEKGSLIRDITDEIPMIQAMIQAIFFDNLREQSFVTAIIGDIGQNTDLPKEYYTFSLMLDDLIDYSKKHLTALD